MPLDLLTFGEALAEIMRKRVGAPLDLADDFIGPYPSGAPFIFAVQAARLGARVAAIGCVGANETGEPDAFGRNLIRQLQTDGVDTRGVHPIPGHTTGVAFIAYNTDGTRDFVFHAQHAAAGQLSPDMLDESLFVGLKCLHITGSALSIGENALDVGKRALELAHKHGAIISFDPNIRPQLMSPERARVEFQPYLQAATYILPTADETLLLTGEKTLEHAALSLLNGHTDRLVVITDGERGCRLFSLAADGSLSTKHIPGFSVTEVDPTGAGDCFDAGFLTRILTGDTPAQAARYANACGALAVTAQGPMAGAKPTAEVETFLQHGSPNG